MKLTELGFSTETVKTAKGEIPLRGLSLNDVLSLYRMHGPALEKVYKRATAEATIEGDDQKLLETGSDVAALIAAAAPEILAQVIAIAADEPDAAEFAARLPFPTQIEALEKIGKLTFSQEGGPKKVLEAILRMTGGVTTLMTDLQKEVRT